MPAKFYNTRGQFANENMLPTLYGKRFPTDDIQALWHMVPGEFSVEFSTGTHEFVIKDLSWLAPGQDTKRLRLRTIKAKEASNYDLWVATFQDLCNEAHAATLAAQNIDPKRAP